MKNKSIDQSLTIHSLDGENHYFLIHKRMELYIHYLSIYNWLIKRSLHTISPLTHIIYS